MKKAHLTMDSFHGTPDRIRTYDLWLRKPTLYPAELRVLVATRQRLPLRRNKINLLSSSSSLSRLLLSKFQTVDFAPWFEISEMPNKTRREQG